MAAGGWYNSAEGLKAMRDFHQNFAREPTKEIKEAKKKLEEVIKDVTAWFAVHSNQLQKTEYTGSSYEGLKIASSKMELDVMFIFKHGSKLDVKTDPQFPRFAYLDPSETDAFKDYLMEGHLSPDKIKNRFHGDLQLWLNSRKSEVRGEVKISYGGAAIRAEVFHKPEPHSDWQFWFDVDLVPAFEVNHNGTEIYVAKQRVKSEPAWRHSYSVEEKKKLRSIDDKNGCRKQVIRILKVIRDREPGLNNLVSFYIKNAVIVLSETEDLDWSVGNLAARVLDVMAFLSRKLLEGDLRHPCDGKVNIFLDLDDVVRQNMGHRLKAIINSEPESQKIFCASSQAGPSCSGDSKTPTTSPVAKMVKQAERPPLKQSDIDVTIKYKDKDISSYPAIQSLVNRFKGDVIMKLQLDKILGMEE